jgi:hypothetical protein
MKRLNGCGRIYPSAITFLGFCGAFVVPVSVMKVIEETVVGLIHGKTIGASLAAIGGGTPEQIIATAMVLFLIFLPFFGLLALGDVGIKTLLRLFFVERRAFERLETPA